MYVLSPHRSPSSIRPPFRLLENSPPLCPRLAQTSHCWTSHQQRTPVAASSTALVHRKNPSPFHLHSTTASSNSRRPSTCTTVLVNAGPCTPTIKYSLRKSRSSATTTSASSHRSMRRLSRARLSTTARSGRTTSEEGRRRWCARVCGRSCTRLGERDVDMSCWGRMDVGCLGTRWEMLWRSLRSCCWMVVRLRMCSRMWCSRCMTGTRAERWDISNNGSWVKSWWESI